MKWASTMSCTSPSFHHPAGRLSKSRSLSSAGAFTDGRTDEMTSGRERGAEYMQGAPLHDPSELLRASSQYIRKVESLLTGAGVGWCAIAEPQLLGGMAGGGTNFWLV